jgi:hypothetical protein
MAELSGLCYELIIAGCVLLALIYSTLLKIRVRTVSRLAIPCCGAMIPFGIMNRGRAASALERLTSPAVSDSAL